LISTSPPLARYLNLFTLSISFHAPKLADHVEKYVESVYTKI